MGPTVYLLLHPIRRCTMAGLSTSGLRWWQWALPFSRHDRQIRVWSNEGDWWWEDGNPVVSGIREEIEKTWWLDLFSIAAMINYHQLCGLIQQPFTVLRFWRSEVWVDLTGFSDHCLTSPKSRCWQGSVPYGRLLGRICFQVHSSVDWIPVLVVVGLRTQFLCCLSAGASLWS